MTIKSLGRLGGTSIYMNRLNLSTAEKIVEKIAEN
jgi:hypothetical protein